VFARFALSRAFWRNITSWTVVEQIQHTLNIGYFFIRDHILRKPLSRLFSTSLCMDRLFFIAHSIDRWHCPTTVIVQQQTLKLFRSKQYQQHVWRSQSCPRHWYYRSRWILFDRASPLKGIHCKYNRSNKLIYRICLKWPLAFEHIWSASSYSDRDTSRWCTVPVQTAVSQIFGYRRMIRIQHEVFKEHEKRLLGLILWWLIQCVLSFS
jgi:hypothetical protein